MICGIFFVILQIEKPYPLHRYITLKHQRYMFKKLLKRLSIGALCLLPAGSMLAGSTDSQGNPIFYLRGNFNETDWQPIEAYRFTRSGNTYSFQITAKNSIDKCEFKISDDNWDVNYGYKDIQYAVNTSQYVDGVSNGQNFTTDGLTDCVISFTYDVNNPGETEIKFVIDGKEPETSTDPSTPVPSGFTIYYDNSATQYDKVNIHYWANPQTEWPGVEMTQIADYVWKYTFPEDPSRLNGFLFVNHTKSPQTANYDHAPVNNHIYKGTSSESLCTVIDNGVYDPSQVIEPEPGPGPNPGNAPAVYLRGDFCGESWPVNDLYKFTYENGVYTLNITSANAVPAGSQFKIASEDWSAVNLGGQYEGITIDATQIVTLKATEYNLRTANGISAGSISFSYPYDDSVAVRFVIDGTAPAPVAGLSGTLPVLYINVYTDENHTAYNNEVISKDLSHKDYFKFAEYWLDVNDCQWLKDEGAKNVGSAEEPLPLQIKARGNYTRTGFSKKPFKLKLDKKQSLLGLSKSKHFAILAHADDNFGYLRNFIGFDLGKRIGLPWTPSQQPVEVVINGDYRGLYFLTESIRVEEERVNIAELEDNVSDAGLVSGGYIVELDNYDEPDDAQIRMSEKSCVGGYTDMLRITFDTPEVYSDLQRRFIREQFEAMNNAVGNCSNDLWKYMDMDDAVRYYIVEEMISHTESYHGSTYLFRDRGEGQKWHFSPLWDCGNAFNGPTNGFFYNNAMFGCTWIASIRQNREFNSRLHDTWLWFMSNNYDGLISDIDAYVDHIRQAAKADRARWKDAPLPNYSGTITPVVDNTDMTSRRNAAVSHLTSKISWLKDQFGDYTVGKFSEPQRDATLAAELPDYAKDVSSIVEWVIGPDDLDTSAAEYYNLQGMKVTSPVKGEVYIMVTGSKSKKVVIR